MNKLILKSVLMIFTLILCVQFINATAEVRLYDYWSTEGGTTSDYKAWINEGNPATQPYVMIANYGSSPNPTTPPRVECWDFTGTHNAPSLSTCTGVSETALSECQINCYQDFNSGRYVQTSLGWMCANTPCGGAPTPQSNYGYAAQTGSGYYMRIRTYLDWTQSISISSPAFRVRYYYNCSPSLGDGEACKDSYYYSGWTNLASTIYLGNKKGTICQNVGSRYFNYKFGYGSSSSVQYGTTGDCYMEPGTQACDPDKAYWSGGSGLVTTSTGTIPNPCNGNTGHPCTSNSQCIADLGLTCINGFCLASETSTEITNLEPADFTTFPYTTLTVDVKARIKAGNRDADVSIKWIEEGSSAEHFYTFPNPLQAGQTNIFTYRIGVVSNKTYQWQWFTNTTRHSGMEVNSGNIWHFSINPAPSYIPPSVTLNSPLDGYTFPSGTTNVTLNYTIIAGSHAVNSLVYFDGIGDYSCIDTTPSSTTITYTCSKTFTGNSHNWKVEIDDTAYGGTTDTFSPTRFFYVNTTTLPPTITIEQPKEYILGWGNETNYRLHGIFSPSVTVQTKTESLNLSFYFDDESSPYYTTTQGSNLLVTYTPISSHFYCYIPGRSEQLLVCGPIAHFVEGQTPSLNWYNSSRPFYLYLNTSYPKIANLMPYNQSTYSAGTTMIEFEGEAISCGSTECRNANIYLIIDDGLPILVGTQTATEKAKNNWGYNKTMTSGLHNYYWKLDNTPYGGTTTISAPKSYFTINATEPGYVAPSIINTAPPNATIYPAETTSIILQANLTVGTYSVDTYYILDGIYHPIENNIYLNKSYNIIVPATAGTHNWTFGVTDIPYATTQGVNQTDIIRTYIVNTNLPTITHLSPPNGNIVYYRNQTVTARITTLSEPATAWLEYTDAGTDFNITGISQPAGQTKDWNYTIETTGEIVSWRFCAETVSGTICAPTWTFTYSSAGIPTITHISPPSGSTNMPLENTVIAQMTTTTIPAYIRLKYIEGGTDFQIDSETSQPAGTSRNYTYNIKSGPSQIIRWQYCSVIDSSENCHSLWNYTIMPCAPDDSPCSSDAYCCSGYCSRGYCHYDTGFYELNLSKYLVNPDNVLCDKQGKDCGLIPEIYYGTLRVFSKIGMPFIFISFTILLVLIMLMIGAFIIRVARGQ